MKKYSWIVALLALTVAFAFVACDDGDSSKKKDPPVLPDVTVEGEAIVIYAVGGKEADITIEKNTFAVDNKKCGSLGFAYDFPEEVLGKGYGSVIVEMELLGPATGMNPNFISFNGKSDSKLGTDVLIVGHTQQYHNELKIGTIVDKEVSAACSDNTCLQYTAGTCIVGAKGSAAYPMSKLTNGLIAFQFNSYAGDITSTPWTNGGDTEATFKVAVTKITFIGSGVEEPPPPPPNEEVDPAAFNAATGMTTLTNDWGTNGSMVFDSATGIITRAAGGSSCFGIPVTLGLTEDDTIVVTYIAIATVETVKVTAKVDGSGGDLTPATYLDLKGDGVQATQEIPAGRYQAGTPKAFADPTKLYFQDNSGTDAEWKMKIISVAKK